MKGFITGSPLELEREVHEERVGRRQYPLISGPEAPWKFVHGALAIEAMLTDKPYPFKSLFCFGGNPVVVMPDTKKVL
jgi:anaerobic selenocysteine-containing dehydrogenase